MTIVSVRKAAKAHAKIPQLQKLLAPLGGVDFFFCPGEKVAILADWGLPLSPAAGVNADPSLVYALKELALENGAVQVDILLRPAPGFDFAFTLNSSGYHKLASEKVQLKDLSQEPALSRPCPLALAGKQIRLYQALLSADLVISLCKFKTGDGLLFGSALNNMTLVSPDLCQQPAEHKSRALVDAWSTLSADLYLADGMRGSTGYQPQAADFLLAASDPLALDTVLCAVAGIEPSSIEYLCLGAQYGLGHSHPGEIVLSGDHLSQIIDGKEIQQQQP